MRIPVDTDDIVRILSIDRKYIPENIQFRIDGKEIYRDMVEDMEEHLYSQEVFNEMRWSEEELKTVKEIKWLCDHYGCRYWRMIN